MRAVAVVDSRMPARTILFIVIALAIGIVCVRLGFWQLNRREMRRASNSLIRARSEKPAVPVQSLAGDSGSLRFRRTIVTGEPDYEHEIVLTHRGNEGAPGVDLLTPVRIPGSDSAVLVNRGWVYSPDGVRVDQARWRERERTFTGYVDTYESAPGDTVRQGAIRRASYEAIARTLPYPIRDFYVVALGDSVSMAEPVAGQPAIVRLHPPRLSEGPHLSYAIQWFAFAAIAAIGASFVTARSMQKASS